jgi:hypothetical protein
MICGILLLTSIYPLAVAWRTNAGTTLRSALCWAFAAWATWGIALFVGDLRPGGTEKIFRYAALCVTGCAAVAVLGARRPGVGAWNFVVLTLLVALMLPIAEGLGELHLDPLRLVFLAGPLVVGALNYLPTRLAKTVVALTIGCGVEIALLSERFAANPGLQRASLVSRCLLAVSPWLAWADHWARGTPSSPFDQIWLGFRDRFGLVWGQRVREQFNNAANHAGWPVVLRWRGLRLQGGTQTPDKVTEDQIVGALHALLKRFGPIEK